MRRAVVVLVLVLLLASCSDDAPAPRFAAEPTSTPTPTPIGTPRAETAPTLPPEATGEDAAAAEAFATYLWALDDHARATGDVEALAELALDWCDGCQEEVLAIAEHYARGGTITGGGSSVRVERSASYDAGSVPGLEVWVSVARPEVVIGRFDAEDEVRPAGETSACAAGAARRAVAGRDLGPGSLCRALTIARDALSARGATVVLSTQETGART